MTFILSGNYSIHHAKLRRKSSAIEKSETLIEDEKRGDVSMIDIGAVGILTLFLIFGNLEAVTIVNHHSDDEYVLEHEVLREDALVEAKKLQIYPGKESSCSNDSRLKLYERSGRAILPVELCKIVLNARYIVPHAQGQHRVAWKRKKKLDPKSVRRLRK